jgi:hypothetical protein
MVLKANMNLAKWLFFVSKLVEKKLFTNKFLHIRLTEIIIFIKKILIRYYTGIQIKGTKGNEKI